MNGVYRKVYNKYRAHNDFMISSMMSDTNIFFQYPTNGPRIT